MRSLLVEKASASAGRSSDAFPDTAAPDESKSQDCEVDVHSDSENAINDEENKKSLSFHLAFIAININTFVYSLDATTLSVALPSIAQDNNGTTLESFWASTSYILLVVVTQPLYTTFSEIFGRKRPLLVAYVFFFAGSLVFALANNMTAVIAGRVLQGLGGGGLDLLGEIIVSDMTTLKERSKYLGILALPISVGSILGPSLGAVFSSLVSWHWIGWINLPLLGISFFLVVFFLRLQPIEGKLGEKMKRLDWGGVLLSIPSITLFVVPLSWAGALYPWGSYQTLVPLFIGIALLIAFAIYEARPESPIIPHRIFRSRTASWTLLGNFAEGASLFVLLQYLPLFYQAVGLNTIIQSAIFLLPTSIVSVVAAVAAVIVVGVVGKGYNLAIQISWVLLTVGTGILALFTPSSPTSMLLGLPVIWGAGVGALLRLLHLPMQASVKNIDDTGVAIGVLLSIRLLGGLVGLAIGSSVFNNIFASTISASGPLPAALSSLSNPNEAIRFIPMLRVVKVSQEDLDMAINAYCQAIRAIFYVMTGFGALGLFSSLFPKELTLEKEVLGRQQFEKD